MLSLKMADYPLLSRVYVYGFAFWGFRSGFGRGTSDLGLGLSIKLRFIECLYIIYLCFPNIETVIDVIHIYIFK